MSALPQKAIRFSGVRGAVVLGPASLLGLNGDFTVEAWLRPLARAHGDQPVLGSDSATPGKALKLGLRDGQPVFCFGGNDTHASLSLPAGTWAHLSWRYTSATGEQAIFVNGALVARSLGRAPFQSAANRISVGRFRERNHLTGDLADVRIWALARADAEIAAAATGAEPTSTTGLKVRLQADKRPSLPEGATPDVTWRPKRVAGPAEGPLAATPALPVVSGKPAFAVRLSGTTGAFTGPKAAALGLPQADFTATAWVRLADARADHQSVIGNDGGKALAGLSLGVRRRKVFMSFLGDEVGGTADLEPGKWVHLGWRYTRRTGEMAVFVNGAPAAAVIGKPAFAGVKPVLLGRSQAKRALAGDLAAITLWDLPLTDAEMTRDAAGEAVNAVGRVAAWRCDSSGLLIDQGGRGHPAALDGAAQRVSGPGASTEIPATPVTPSAAAPPASTSAFAARLIAAAEAGPVNLAELSTGLGDAAGFFKDLPAPLSLSDAEVETSPGGVRVSGSVPIFGATAAASVDFGDTAKGPRLRRVLLRLDDGFRFTLPGLPWFGLEAVELDYDRSEGAATGALRGLVIAGDSRVDLTLPLPLPEGDVVLRLAEPDGLNLPGLDAIASLLGGGDVLDGLKDALAAAQRLGLRRFDLTVGTGGLSRLDINFHSDASLELIPGGLSLSGLRAELGLSRPLSAAGRSWGGLLGGSLVVGASAISLELKRSEGDPVWSLGLAEGSALTLPSVGSLAGAFGLGADLLPDGLGDLAIALDDLHAELDPFSRRVWGIYAKLHAADPWSLLGLQITEVQGTFAVKDPASASRQFTARITGKLAFAGASFSVESARTPDEGWSLLASLDEHTPLVLADLVEALIPGDLSLPDAMRQMAITAAELDIDPGLGRSAFTGRLSGDWTLDLGPAGLTLRELMLRAERPRKGAPTALYVRGVTELGGETVTLTASFGPQGWRFVGQISRLPLGPVIEQLCDAGSALGVPMPSGTLTLDLTDVRIGLRSGALALRASTGAFPVMAAEFSRDGSGAWGYRVALQPGDDWRLSSISSELAVLDGLDLAGSILVVSSRAEPAAAFDELPAFPSTSLARGLTLVANLGLDGTGVDELIGIHSLLVRAELADPRNFALAASIGGQIRLASQVLLVDPSFSLVLASPSFAIQLSLTVLVEIQDPALAFIGLMSVSPTGALFSATMRGIWSEPFGLSGTAVADLALELGVNFGGVPSVGLAGSLAIGGDSGRLAVKFDSTNPSRSMLVIAFNRLRPLGLLAQLCDAAVGGALPDAVVDLANGIELRDCELYVVPVPTTIGALVFPAGTRVKGGISLFGFTGKASAEVKPTGGIHITGSVDRIDLGGVLQLTDATGTTGPSLDVDLQPGGRPGGRMSGRAKLLGWTQSVDVLLEPTRQTFHLAGTTGLCTYALDVVSAPPSFEASGRVSWGVKANIGPFEFKVKILPRIDLDFLGPITAGASIPPIGFDMVVVPNIDLDFGLDGAFAVGWGSSGFHLSLAAGVHWGDAALTMPDLNLSVSPSDLSALPGLLVDHIQDNAEAIFADLFAQLESFGDRLLREAEAFGRKVWEGAVSLAEDLGREVLWLADQVAVFASQAAAEVQRVAEAAAAEVARWGAEAAKFASDAALQVASIATVIDEKATSDHSAIDRPRNFHPASEQSPDASNSRGHWLPAQFTNCSHQGWSAVQLTPLAKRCSQV